MKSISRQQVESLTHGSHGIVAKEILKRFPKAQRVTRQMWLDVATEGKEDQPDSDWEASMVPDELGRGED